MNRKAAVRLLTCALGLAAGCGPGAPPLDVAIRFVDADQREGASSRPASWLTARPMKPFDRSPPLGLLSATIGNETRFVLASPPRETSVPMTDVGVAEDGRLSVRVPITRALRNAGRIVLIPTIRHQGVWTSLDRDLHAVPAAEAAFTLELDPPRQLTQDRRSVPVVVRAVGAERIPTTVYRTPVVALPADPVLDFSYGILHPSPDQSDVRFSVAACEDEACETIFDRTLDAEQAAQGWREERVELAARAGAKKSFRFETTRSGDDSDAYALPVWGNPTILFRSSRTQERASPFNLILISIDTLRADHLGLYGYSRDTSPRLDRFAFERATVFDALTAASTHTGPSHMSIFTGLPPSVHGVYGRFRRLAARVATFPELLRDRGYATAAFTGGGPLNAQIGFGRGFDQYRVDPGPTAESSSQVERMVERGRKWLGEDRARPFFLFLHTFETHTPYQPQKRYRPVFREDEIAQRRAATTDLEKKTIEQMARYDREIRHVDDTVGPFLDWLDSGGFGTDTIVVILSDHGEEFREHGRMGHKTLPYQSVLHVPLIVAGPGIAAGRRVRSPVSHTSLSKTLLELLEIPHPESLRGRSFARSLQEGAHTEVTEPMVSEAWRLPAPFQPPSVAVRSGDWKLVRTRTEDGDETAFFDLATNPGEKRTTRPPTPVEQEMRAALAAHDSEVASLKADLLPGDAHSAPEAPPPEVEQRLRELGYIR